MLTRISIDPEIYHGQACIKKYSYRLNQPRFRPPVQNVELLRLESSCDSVVKELKNFAIGLKRDAVAVYEAIRQSWNNGPTEGHVNRLKFIKRQMYGRASFDSLLLRILLVT